METPLARSAEGSRDVPTSVMGPVQPMSQPYLPGVRFARMVTGRSAARQIARQDSTGKGPGQGL